MQSDSYCKVNKSEINNTILKIGLIVYFNFNLLCNNNNVPEYTFDKMQFICFLYHVFKLLVCICYYHCLEIVTGW